MTEELHFEDWGATYGSPYLIEDDAPGEDAELAEPVEPFTITPEAPELRELAFVDGVRRVEGLVYHRGEDGLLARGVVGAHACGAVVVHANPGVAYERLRTRRMLILGSGRRAKLAPTLGYGWESHAIASADFDAPVQDLQRRMREAEARLAEQLSAEGWLTIVDGPLNFIRSLDEPVVGYVKTHLRRRLPAELHARVPELGVGQRTPLFLARQSYSAYVRVAARGRHSSPWAGIVRIEVPGVAGARRRPRPRRRGHVRPAPLRRRRAQGPARPAEPPADLRARAPAAPPARPGRPRGARHPARRRRRPLPFDIVSPRHA